MWVYKENKETELYEVGFYTPTGDWMMVVACIHRDHAADYIHYLNGGEYNKN